MLHNGRKRVIKNIRGEDYLIRYYIFNKVGIDVVDTFPFNVFIHKFLKSDIEDPHDHPWDFITIILKGGYYEERYNYNDDINNDVKTTTWRGVGSIQYVRAEQIHRIRLTENVDCWTLFIPFNRRRGWGFWRLNQDSKNNNYVFINNKTYKGQFDDTKKKC